MFRSLRGWYRFCFGRLELSYSKVRAYLDCPWLYRLVYVDGQRPVLSPTSSLGHSIHRTLEAYHRKKGCSMGRLLELYDVHWVREGYSSSEEARQSRERGLKMLEKYWGLEQERKSAVLFMEKEFSFQLGRHKIRGIVDRVDRWPDGRYEVIDYKTYPTVWSRERLEGDLQMGLYGMGARRAWNLDPLMLSIYFLEQGEILSISYEPRREPELEGSLREVSGKILKGCFSPRTEHCPRCSFRKICIHSVSRMESNGTGGSREMG